MARITTTGISISQLNTVFGLGNNLSAYKRSSTSEKSNTIAHAPVSETVSIGRLRGAYPSGTYRNINSTAGSSTTLVNVFPRVTNSTYSAGLSNNSDPENSYTLLSYQGTGNRGYATTSNIFSQTMYTTASLSNTMYFRIANGTTYPFSAGFEEPAAWVVAIGLNHFSFDRNVFFLPPEAFQFPGGDGSGNFQFYFGTWSVPTSAEIYNGNNFFAHFVSGDRLQVGFLNRAQLRAGVIQPVYQIAMWLPSTSSIAENNNAGAVPIWFNSAQNWAFRHGIIPNGADGSLTFNMGWDEILVRGYDLPPEHDMFGTSSTTIRSKAVNPGTLKYIDERLFE